MIKLMLTLNMKSAEELKVCEFERLIFLEILTFENFMPLVNPTFFSLDC